MSSVEKRVPNGAVIPSVTDDLFKDNQNSRFALIRFSSEDVLSYSPGSLEEGYLKLRAKVYIDQTNNLGRESRRPDGTELDADDERSTHFVVAENLLGKSAIFACLRLIEKKDDNLLPIEQFFPEKFKDTPASIHSVEVSRLIIRHNSPRVALAVEKKLFAAGLKYTLDGNFGPVYGVVEPILERSLGILKVENQRVTEPKYIAEYKSENVGIKIDQTKLEHGLGVAAMAGINESFDRVVYWGKVNE